ncbi:MAG TPA: emp24/gp25L/p24 family protein, partial [Pyrinomonadaceae bacterium]
LSSGTPLLPVLFLVLVFSAGTAQTSNDQTTLQPGTPIERTIGPNESHSFTIRLEDGQYLQFVVNQHGVDLIVRVFSPTGKRLGDFDSPNGSEGPENVSIVAMKGGDYRIVVSPLDSTWVEKPGRYEIKTLDIREATEQELKVGKDEDERKAKGLALLDEIVNSIPEIRQPQTRTRVKLQSATLLWTIDDKKAAKLLSESVTDARNYLLSFRPDDPAYEEAAAWAQQIRADAVQTLAFRDAEAALTLLRSTRKPIKNEIDRREAETDKQMELTLASQIAAKNPERAFELAEASLKDGFSHTLLQTVENLNKVNPELGGTLSKDLVAKLLDTKLMQSPEGLAIAVGLLQGPSPPGFTNNRRTQNALISEQDYRALVQKALSEALSAKPGEETSTNMYDVRMIPQDGMQTSTLVARVGGGVEMLLLTLRRSLGNDLDRFVPGGAAAVDKKLKEMHGGRDIERSNSVANLEDSIRNSSPDAARETINQAPPEIKEQLVQRLAEQRATAGNYAEARQLITESTLDPRARRQALDNLERQTAFTEAAHGRMEEALKHLAKILNSEERAVAISEMAYQIGAGQKTPTALALLETARSLVGTSIQAESHAHMRALLQLAKAFSRYDAKRGFEILEPLVDQFNELSAAARTLNGFGLNYFLDGELSLQNGNSLATLASPMSSTLGILSVADFDRAKATSDRFQLPEVRLNVYLSIVQQAIMPNGIYSPSVANVNMLNR